MVFAMLSRVARVRVTVGYAVLLVAVTTALLKLGPGVQDRVIRHASTNLHNLGHGHVGTLLGSAFIVDAGPVACWLPGLACLLGLGELLWRSGRLLVAFAVGHVGATLLVAAGLTAAVTNGWLPVSVARAPDVGTSYGATAVLGALTPAIPRRWRPMWIGWWLAAAVAVVAVGADFTDVGHLVALMLGMVVAMRFGTPRPWTWPLVALLAVAATFGFLVIAGTEGALPMAAVSGLAGGLLGTVITLLTTLRRLPEVDERCPQSPIHPQAGSQGCSRSMGVS
ncbi:MAG TPA: rhomboid-like protein [Mycobacterium sp.]|nr:rhomboid-like protein [Mycobacterium sp.]